MSKTTEVREKEGIPLREMDGFFRPDPDFDAGPGAVVKLNPKKDRQAHIAEHKSTKNADYLRKYALKNNVEINDLISAIEDQVALLTQTAQQHADYHDNHPGDTDEAWEKIKQYDAINRLMTPNFPEIILSPGFNNKPEHIFLDVDHEDLNLAREWNNGDLKNIVDVLEKHIEALNAGKMTVLYEHKTERYTYYEHENHLAEMLKTGERSVRAQE